MTIQDICDAVKILWAARLTAQEAGAQEAHGMMCNAQAYLRAQEAELLRE